MIKPIKICASLIFSMLLAACGGDAPSGIDSKAGSPEIPCSKRSDPRVLAMSDDGIRLASSVGLAAGRFALPSNPAPTQLVVFFHGHGNDSCSFRNHLRKITERGAVAVAMDYTGQREEPVENYGWFVRAGAADSIAAAKYFLERYPSITQVFAMGISMGANMSGFAMASADAVRADGSPLFDYWVAVEGVHNLTEEYFIARAIAPAVSAGALAVQEIEEENGGSFEEVPERYIEITNVARVQDMTGLKGVALIHAVDDGLVPYGQSQEMFFALNAVEVPAQLHTVLLNGGAESGTTATGIPLGPIFEGAGQTYESPFAGHGWEGSDTHLVMVTGFEQLFALMDGGTVTAGAQTVVVGGSGS